MRDKSGKSPLDITMDNIYTKKDFFDIADYLVKHGCHSDNLEVNLLCGACRWGDLETVKELVGQLKINPNGELCITVTRPCNCIEMFQDLYIIMIV